MLGSSALTNNTIGLTLSLNPSEHLDIDETITFGPQIRSSGSKLVAGIASRIRSYWRDSTNAAIKERIDDVDGQSNVEIIVQPTLVPGAKFMPLKAGIVLCWILRRCLEDPFWPGDIKATV